MTMPNESEGVLLAHHLLLAGLMGTLMKKGLLSREEIANVFDEAQLLCEQSWLEDPNTKAAHVVLGDIAQSILRTSP